MAGVTSYGSNSHLRRIDFRDRHGRRQYIRLGAVPKREAERIGRYVDRIVSDQKLGRPHDHDVVEWLSGLDAAVAERQQAAGLVEGTRQTATRLGDFLDQAMASMTIKPGTRTFYGHTVRNLWEYFGKAKVLREITRADAAAWRAWLVNHEGLSKATVGRRAIAARTLFKLAVEWELIPKNPMEGVKGGSQANPHRLVYVPAEDVRRVLEQIPCPQWRAIVALARWGGIRTPSETLGLTWQDVNWDSEAGTLRVRSPKTEHHPGHEERIIPLFPEVRAALLDVFEDAHPGETDIITRHRKSQANLRTQLHRWIRAAGRAPWPRCFHNLRASRETAPMREYDRALVCRWIGNSPAVAARHYASISDMNADLRRAVAGEAHPNTHPSEQIRPHQTESSETDPEPEIQRVAGFGEVWGGVSKSGKDREWAQQDSNLRPHPYQGCALTS